jgi:hypothetical protein
VRLPGAETCGGGGRCSTRGIRAALSCDHRDRALHPGRTHCNHLRLGHTCHASRVRARPTGFEGTGRRCARRRWPSCAPCSRSCIAARCVELRAFAHPGPRASAHGQPLAVETFDEPYIPPPPFAMAVCGSATAGALTGGSAELPPLARCDGASLEHQPPILVLSGWGAAVAGATRRCATRRAPRHHGCCEWRRLWLGCSLHDWLRLHCREPPDPHGGAAREEEGTRPITWISELGPGVSIMASSSAPRRIHASAAFGLLRLKSCPQGQLNGHTIPFRVQGRGVW